MTNTINDYRVIIKCIITDSGGNIGLVHDTANGNIPAWHLPAGIVCKLDKSLDAAVDRILLENTATRSYSCRIAASTILPKSDGASELVLWYICNPFDHRQCTLQKWTAVHSMSNSAIPYTVMRFLVKQSSIAN